jgi:hypothetical protein
MVGQVEAGRRESVLCFEEFFKTSCLNLWDEKNLGSF